MYPYTFSTLKSRLNGRVQNRLGVIVDLDATVVDAVQEVYTAVDLRSAKRRHLLDTHVGGSFLGPSDIKQEKIIDLRGENIDQFSLYRLFENQWHDRPIHEALAVDTYNGAKFLRSNLPDDLLLNKYLHYYSVFAWLDSQNDKFIYLPKEDSILVAEDDELPLFFAKLDEFMFRELDEIEKALEAEARFTNLAEAYQIKNPSEALLLQNYYH